MSENPNAIVLLTPEAAIQRARITSSTQLGERDLKRFWSKVRKGNPDDCWLWTGAPDKHGYGTIGIGGRNGHEYFAHRISFIIANGELSNDLKVCHSCDNPICVNPHHLWVGTQGDNMRDMYRKGRESNENKAKGSRVGTSTLKEWQIPAIRKAYANGMKQRDIAKLHGCSQTAVWQITSGRYWKHVKDES